MKKYVVDIIFENPFIFNHIMIIKVKNEIALGKYMYEYLMNGAVKIKGYEYEEFKRFKHWKMLNGDWISGDNIEWYKNEENK